MKIGARAGIALFLSLLLSWTLLVAPSQSAENIIDPNQGWSVPENTAGLGSQNGYFGERSSDDRDYSALLDVSKMKADAQEDPTCVSLDDPKCASTQNFIYYAQIPVCKSTADTNCIDSVSAIRSCSVF